MGHEPLPRGPKAQESAGNRTYLGGRRDLSQESLGAESDTHRNYVGAVERDEINPTFRILLKLCHGLRISLVELATVYERQYMAQLGIVSGTANGSGDHA